MKKQTIIALITALIGIATGCRTEYPTYEGPSYIMFSTESHTLGVLDAEEWFEIPIVATTAVDYDRNVGVEIIERNTSAIEGYHFVVESSTVTIPSGELTTSLRLKGIPQTMATGESLEIALRLVIEEEQVWDKYGTDTTVQLVKCCPTEMEAFTGYAVLTSTWVMNYMGTEALLIHTERDPNNSERIILRDMFYEGYDVAIDFHTEDRLNPIITMQEHMIGTTGEAFGTIYGNGELMMQHPVGYTSYYSTCEGFAVLYTQMYVEEVGTVGLFVNIIEWVSDAEAERILREGF